MRRKFLFWIIGWVFLYFIFFKILPYFDDRYHGCYIRHEVYIQKIRAKVNNKFLDSLNHNHMVVNYTNENNQKGSMGFNSELRGLYNTLNVGDSLIKAKNSIYYKIKFNATGTDTLIKIETDCKDSLENKP